jgi:hypothetical protein
MWKIRHTISRPWNMARNLKNVENETQTVFDLEFGKEHSKTWKRRNAHCSTWSMVRIVKITEKEIQTL